MSASSRPSFFLLTLFLSALAACGSPQPPIPPVTGFDDHTKDRLLSRADFDALSASEGGAGLAATKFVVTRFDSEAARAVVFLDSAFYAMHDEWYWFRLVNGQPVPGEDAQPVTLDRAFTSVAEIAAWARTQPILPLDLLFVEDDRLYSPRFYELALAAPRRLGVGSLLHIPARTLPAPRAELWAFELEYVDAVSHAELTLFFRALEASLPRDIGGEGLQWLVRSPAQEQLAQQMRAQHLPYADRVLRYRDLAVPGETAVYNPGLTAGRLRMIRSTDVDQQSASTDIVVLDHLPDSLPPAAGLITAVPQTPLAHTGLLAKNRGIPNAYLGGAFDDPALSQLARAYAPVAVWARDPDQLKIVAMTESEYHTWAQLRTQAPIALDPMDTANAPYTIALDAIPPADIDPLRLLIGGKAAGMLHLTGVEAVEVPDRPLVITIRAYVEHLAPLLPTIRALLGTTEFRASERARYLLLEGPERYAERYARAADTAYAAKLLAMYGAQTPVGDLLRAGGLVAMVRARPIAPETLAVIRRALELRFADLSPQQALRFRSSSNIEDIEGFNGAGLYVSNTGFLDPSAQVRPKDRALTIERAIAATWASYWGFEAFEERRSAQIDSLSGAMAVLVHARLDDALELANGVLTLTLRGTEPRQGEARAPRAVMDLNVQKGAVSVTNPDPTSSALPEIDRVLLDREGGTLEIRRLRASTLSKGPILDDVELESLFRQALAVSQRWLAADNAGRSASQAKDTLTLDFEFRKAAAGWPALRSGPPHPVRLVYRQVRSLDPGLRAVPAPLHARPIPRDLLARARRIEVRRCQTDAITLTAWEVFSDPLVSPDLGFSAVPFTATLIVDFTRDVPTLGRRAADHLGVDHLAFAAVTHGDGSHGDTPPAWQLSLTLDPAALPEPVLAEPVLDAVTFAADGTYRLTNAHGELTGSDASCQTDLVFSTPAEYLRTLVER